MAVIEILLGDEKHLSAKQIYERVKVDFPMTSLATIYKTLAVLKKMGEILEIDLGTDSARYDGGNGNRHDGVGYSDGDGPAGRDRGSGGGGEGSLASGQADRLSLQVARLVRVA